MLRSFRWIRPFSRTVFRAPQHRLLSAAHDMFCYQCEQTQNEKACTMRGVCGKDADVAALQDFVVHACKGVSQYNHRLRELGLGPHGEDAVLDAVFTTLTNVNFDATRFLDTLHTLAAARDQAKAALAKAAPNERLSGAAEFFVPKDLAWAVHEGTKTGIQNREEQFGAELNSMRELLTYAAKGTMAYYVHARELGAKDDKVLARFSRCLSELAEDTLTMEECVSRVLEMGETNLNVLSTLDKCHTDAFGHPEPTEVATTPKEGKCILVSGHDLADLKSLLEATEGTGINVYTHGEMLPAHGYPGLKKFKHLAGHFGSAWQLQKMEFSLFPGPIVMTSNCLIEPRKSYAPRQFTRSAVGWPGVQHLPTRSWEAVVDAASASRGFFLEDMEETPPLTVGFGHHSLIAQVDQLADALKTGEVQHLFVIGGCDGTEGLRNYFSEAAKVTPRDSLILTMGCGKFRLNKLALGKPVGTFPRLMDCGQCNDAYSAVLLAQELATLLKCSVDDLPISFVLSWFEQKAVALLSTLFHLNLRNVRLGPALPAFLSPKLLQVVKEKFEFKAVNLDDPAGDVEAMLKGK